VGIRLVLNRSSIKRKIMRRKIVGIILSILGIANLVSAFIYMNGSDSADHLTSLFARGILGTIAFFAGIWLVDHSAGRRAM
jgi:hypothetical protein